MYTGIISIAEMGIKLWSLDHIRFVDYSNYGVRGTRDRDDRTRARDAGAAGAAPGHYNAICRPADELLRIVAGMMG